MKITLKINQLLDRHEWMFKDAGLVHISEDHGECEICEELQRLGYYLEHGIQDMKDIEEFEANKEFYIKRKQVKEKQIYPNRKGVLNVKPVTKEEYLALPSDMPEYKKAEILNLNPKTLIRKRKEWGLLDQNIPRNRIIKPLDKEDYLALPSDMAEYEKAKILKISMPTLTKRLKQWGIYKEPKTAAIDTISKEEFEALPRELSVIKKAKLLGVTRQTVYNFINREYEGEEKIKMRGESRNDTYFRRL